jgi:hypothetical protein
MDALMELLMLVVVCLALAWMFLAEGNVPAAVVFLILGLLATGYVGRLLRERRR